MPDEVYNYVLVLTVNTFRGLAYKNIENFFFLDISINPINNLDIYL